VSDPATRAGFIGLAGRPNVGKSTLANAIVGSKVAIVSDRPQTTRRAVRGVATNVEHGWQLILVDMPGVQKPRDALTQRMQRRVEREVSEADVVCLVLNGEQGVGPGDRFIANTMIGARGRTPVIGVLNKCDRLDRGETVQALAEAAKLQVIDELFPISAKTGEGVEPLIERLAGLIPASPFLYPPEDRSDLPSRVHLAELIREQVLRRTREEVPHAVEVEVTEVNDREDGLIDIVAHVWAETESQKGILIGKNGKMIHDIGAAARKELESDLDSKIFLNLRVRVRPSWRRDDGLLDRLGID
jgi:GTP-binding protein Era